MAQRRKEVRFFDQHYHRGLPWYESFFPDTVPTPAAIGEFSPGYLFGPEVPARVQALTTVERLIVSLRDPIDRLVSHYHSRAQQDRFRGSLEAFIEVYPHIVDQGRYAAHLERWLDCFDRKQLLVLMFESATSDVERTKRRLAEFLGLRVGRFPADSGATPENTAFVPRQPRLHAAARGASRFLRRHDLDLGRRLGTHLRGPAFRGPAAASRAAIPPDLRRRLVDLYQPDSERLAGLVGLSVAMWPVMAAERL